MRSSHSLDRLETAFDDDRLVANAGLLLPATLAQHLGLQQLVDAHLDLGAAPGRANVGDKLLTLIASALAGGDCIDDADALRAGGTASVLGCAVKAPSTLGTFLRSFRWGHVRQLDRVTRELLARAWATGAGPGAAPFTIDLDSTICETYGLAKEGARHHGYTGVRGYHPLLAVAAGSGDVLMARLREGRAHTARGAAHFLRETIGRVRAAGASGQLTMRADSGFYAHAVVAVCRKLGVPAGTTLDARHRDGPDGPGHGTHPTAFITDRAGQTLELEADHRRHAEIENAIRQVRRRAQSPAGRFAANGAWLAVQATAADGSDLGGALALARAVDPRRSPRRRSQARRPQRRPRRGVLERLDRSPTAAPPRSARAATAAR